MGGGNHHACIGMVIPGGKRQGGHGHQGIINPHLHAVGSQHPGSLLGKHIRVDAAVVGNGNQLIAPLGLHPVGKALGGLTHGVNIHPVGTGTQHAPQTGSTEFQRNRKALFDFVVITGNGRQLRRECRVIQPGFLPAFIIIQIHLSSPFLMFNIDWFYTNSLRIL